MKLLSKRKISDAPPERAAAPPVTVAISAVPSAVPAVPSGVSSGVSGVSSVSAAPVPAISASITAQTTTADLAMPISNTVIENTESNLPTSMAVTSDISMESPPRPEGSSRATGGILRN